MEAALSRDCKLVLGSAMDVRGFGHIIAWLSFTVFRPARSGPLNPAPACQHKPTVLSPGQPALASSDLRASALLRPVSMSLLFCMPVCQVLPIRRLLCQCACRG